MGHYIMLVLAEGRLQNASSFSVVALADQGQAVAVFSQGFRVGMIVLLDLPPGKRAPRAGGQGNQADQAKRPGPIFPQTIEIRWAGPQRRRDIHSGLKSLLRLVLKAALDDAIPFTAHCVNER